MKNPKSILITGASSGIGMALAEIYANDGVTLFMSGRNQQRLNDIQLICEANGATIHTKIIDSRDQLKMDHWIKECHKIHPLDLVIANAGISAPFNTDGDIATHTKDLFDVNVNGVFHTLHPALSVMQAAGKGQIAVVSSLAGYFGMSSAPAYSASKVCIKAYGEALRGLYQKHGIAINVICPGFVRSRITDQNKFPMPFFMEAEKAAKIIKQGLEKNKAHIAFPWQTKWPLALMIRFLPSWLLIKIFSKMPSKE
ncbi:MAG: SDR family NAD(P)-dependent oxidoreductase [Proteobacteria bacterium]|nr:SDR family NAD(P)-dependent oxidoreductase [Pseudomonadota bacterium]